jgi:hypothetical protein
VSTAHRSSPWQLSRRQGSKGDSASILCSTSPSLGVVSHGALYAAQSAAHEEVLGRFDRDMEALAAAELHPAARSAGLTRLLDLLPEAKLRDWAAECARAHRQFADKVHFPVLVQSWSAPLRKRPACWEQTEDTLALKTLSFRGNLRTAVSMAAGGFRAVPF